MSDLSELLEFFCFGNTTNDEHHLINLAFLLHSVLGAFTFPASKGCGSVCLQLCALHME